MGITISTLDFPEEIKNKLKDQLEAGLICDQLESKDYTLFKIELGQQQNFGTMEYLANIIADIVIENLEKRFISSIIKHKHQEFSTDERDIIQKMTIEHLDELLTPDKSLGKILRKEEILRKIIQYFKQSQELNVEGFVRFRLKEYIEELKLAVEMAVDDFIIEKEYNEFIELLKYFVELQEPRIDLVNVLKKENGSFQILDKSGGIINNEYLEGYFAEMFEEEVEYEDLLVSALINIAPLKIMLHFQNDETEKTVEKIFSKRVEVCKGCELCNKYPGN